MSNYSIVGFDSETVDEIVPVDVESWYDRQTRSYISYLVDAKGEQVGSAQFDGDRSGRDASVAMLRRQIEQGAR